MYIIGAARLIDGKGSMTKVDQLITRIDNLRLNIQHYKIAPLRFPWRSSLPENMIRSACSPIIGIKEANKLFNDGKADVAIISGTDKLKTNYTREERHEFMKCFSEGKTHFDGYVELANQFIKEFAINIDDFHNICKHLFNNYLRTYKSIIKNFVEPDLRWFQFINKYFRGVDCANPYVDFEGVVIIIKPEIAFELGVNERDVVKIKGYSLNEIGKDDLESISLFVNYNHITKSFIEASAMAGLDFKDKFLKGEAYLDVYSCYPIPAIAFLLKSGFTNTNDLYNFLDENAITITGGLNLGRAPWNNTVLNSLVRGVELLSKSNHKRYIGIHGNGSLGYQQGFLILHKELKGHNTR